MIHLQIYHREENTLHSYIDGFDVKHSNWMRYVNPAHTSEQQNLVACQVDLDIYFYTIKTIPPDSELLVWYCTEFANRLSQTEAEEERALASELLITCD